VILYATIRLLCPVVAMRLRWGVVDKPAPLSKPLDVTRGADHPTLMPQRRRGVCANASMPCLYVATRGGPITTREPADMIYQQSATVPLPEMVLPPRWVIAKEPQRVSSA